MKIRVDCILPNPEQPRKVFSEVSLRDLARSIQENGLVQPVVVEPAGDGTYILIDGERRLRAHKLAGLREIEAHVREGGSGKSDRLMMAIVANLQREDLSPIEEARAYARLRKMGYSNAKIAHHLGTCAATIVGRLRLLELDDEIQDLYAERMLPVNGAVIDALMSIQDKEARIRFSRKAAGGRMKIKTLVNAADKLSAALVTEKMAITLPAVDVAARYRGIKQPKKSVWDAVSQIGVVPPWADVETAARQTCDGCSLREMASRETCKDCPAVELIVRMMEAVNGRS